MDEIPGADENVAIIRNFVRDYKLHTIQGSVEKTKHLKINAVYLDSSVNDETKKPVEKNE